MRRVEGGAEEMIVVGGEWRHGESGELGKDGGVHRRVGVHREWE